MLNQPLSVGYSRWLYLKLRVMLYLEQTAIADSIGIAGYVLLLHL